MEDHYKNLRILRLMAENIKKLRVVEVEPGSHSVIPLTGPNCAGKTSTLDSIVWALEGASAVGRKPIHEGENKARIELDLGKEGTVELNVIRTFTDKGTYLSVTTEAGTPIASPQTLLNTIRGKIGYDPSEFLRMKSDQQRDRLLQMVTLKPDIDEWKKITGEPDPTENQTADILRYIDDVRAQRTDERKGVKAEVKRLDGAIDTSLAEIPADKRNAKKVNVTQLVEERDAAQTVLDEEARKRSFIEDAKNRIATNNEKGKEFSDELSRTEEEIRRLQEKAQRLKTSMQDLRNSNDAIRKEWEDTKNSMRAPDELPDVSDINNRIAEADLNNRLVMRIESIDKMKVEQREAARKVEKLNTQIKQIDNFKARTLSDARMPVDGLAIEGDYVTYNGFPLEEASHMEQIRVSMELGMAMNPNLRVLIIKEGDKFTKNSMPQIYDLAEKSNFQVWLEAPSDDDTVGIFIEEGMVSKNNLGDKNTENQD